MMHATGVEPPQTEPFCVLSLVLALLAWMSGCCGVILPFVSFLSLPLSLISLITGIIGYKRTRDEPEAYTGGALGLVGAILSGMNLLLVAAIVMMLFLGVGTALLIPLLGEL